MPQTAKFWFKVEGKKPKKCSKTWQRTRGHQRSIKTNAICHSNYFACSWARKAACEAVSKVPRVLTPYIIHRLQYTATSLLALRTCTFSTKYGGNTYCLSSKIIFHEPYINRSLWWIGKLSVWIIWGNKNEGSFILVDIFYCHFNSDTVHTAIMKGLVHLSDTAQILSLLTLIRCSWNQQSWVNLSGPCWVSHEKETLKDNVTGCVTSSRWTGTHIVLIPHSGLNFLLTLCRHRSSCRFMLGFLHGCTRKSLKEAEKLFHFPNVVKSKWPHFFFGSCWICLR